MEIPQAFFDRMKALLGDGFSEYMSFVGRPAFRGLRVNTLKCDITTVSDELNTEFLPAPFDENVYYIPEGFPALGNHPLHHAGAFYLGDPSATSAVSALGVEPGDIILDLCASPGGKTAGIASALNGSGFIIANEAVYQRVGALISNIERMGITNAAVTSAKPDVLCPALAEKFDKVLVDAPCSGEGMMLRGGPAAENWSEKSILSCAGRQRAILDSAALCVRPGGVLVYSTCTFAPEENELTVSAFLDGHPDFELDTIPKKFGVPGFGRYSDRHDLTKAVRIFPMQGGDGHFVARMVRRGNGGQRIGFPGPVCRSSGLFSAFLKENINGNIPSVSVIGDNIFLTDTDASSFPGFIRHGVFAGSVKNGRFEPSHALFAAFGGQSCRSLSLDCRSGELAKFLRGECIPCLKNGYTAVTVCGIPLGFGKASGGVLKNHYPKGLRSRRDFDFSPFDSKCANSR